MHSERIENDRSHGLSHVREQLQKKTYSQHDVCLYQCDFSSMENMFELLLFHSA